MKLATQELEKTAKMLKDNGIDVYVTKWNHLNGDPTYFHFTDGLNVGYCQKEWGGIKFSSCYISTGKGQGSGASCTVDHIYDATIKDAKKAFNYVPSWVVIRNGRPARYENWKHYTEKNKNNYIKY